MHVERGLVKTRLGYMHFRAAGEPGRDAIFLNHINQQSSALYLELMAELAPALRVVAMDYPSHGHSDHVVAQPSLNDYASCIAEVADVLGIRQFSVLGEAVGAATSIALAADYPQRVNKVVLVNCPYYEDRSVADARHGPLKNGLRPEDASGFPLPRTMEFMLSRDPGHAPMHPTQSWMDRINVAQIEAGRERWQALDALHRYDIAGNLARVACPMLLLVGEHFYYLQHRDDFHRANKRLESVVIAGGRFCMTWEHAQEIGARTLAFVRDDV